MAEPRDDLRMRLHLQRAQRLAQGRARERRPVQRRDGARVELGGRWLVDFCGNDYLGLSQQFQVVDALQDAAARDGAGGVASALVCGHHAVHATLERAIAEWQQAPAALLFGSGYVANLAVLQSLLGDDDLCVQDRLNHASLVDGARLAGCRLRRYPHGDAEGALRQLQSLPAPAAVLATDGVFSMDGDVAPLRELALAARVERALFYVDDAHGAGVLGPEGQGSVAAAKLGLDEVPLRLVTFGKALGGYGAAVVGEADLVGHLAETARPHVYTTALPPPLAAATLAALKLARREQWRREKLAALIATFREAAQARGIPLLPSQTAIQPLPCAGEAEALALSKALEDAGYWVAAIRPPTVPEGGSRLRISLSAKHDDAHVLALVDALAAARESIAAPPSRLA